jgi:hypothetical protein
MAAASGTPIGRTLSAAMKKTDPDIEFGELGTKTATKPADHVGLHANPPGAAQFRKHAG